MTANEWNEQHLIGTKIRYYLVSGQSEFHETETRSEAWELGHGEPVVLVQGRSGGVSLKHLAVGHIDCQHENIITGIQWDTCQHCGAITGGNP